MLVDACPNLEKLTLLGCKDTNDRTYPFGIEWINVFAQLKRLRYIELRYCIPNEAFQFENILKENNPSLEVILHTVP